MIDKQGLRLNVGIILVNNKNKLFWGRRVGQQNAWQFPQGGVHEDESPEEAMYRELKEEVGLSPHQVEMIAMSQNWLYYYLPKNFRRYNTQPLCIGQKQRWFMLRLLDHENALCFDSTGSPEFSDSRWVDYWHPVKEVILFKREVYRSALKEFEKILFQSSSEIKMEVTI